MSIQDWRSWYDDSAELSRSKTRKDLNPHGIPGGAQVPVGLKERWYISILKGWRQTDILDAGYYVVSVDGVLMPALESGRSYQSLQGTLSGVIRFFKTRKDYKFSKYSCDEMRRYVESHPNCRHADEIQEILSRGYVEDPC